MNSKRSMMFSSLMGLMPWFGKNSDAIHRSVDNLWIDLRHTFFEMLRAMLALWDAFQIVWPIIERIAVRMMDMMTLRDRTVLILPNLLMETLDPQFPGITTGREIDPTFAAWTVWITAEFNALINDDLDANVLLCWHAMIISP